MSFLGIELFFLLLFADVYRALFVRVRYVLPLILGILISPMIFVLCVASRKYRKSITREFLSKQGVAHTIPQWLAKALLKFIEPTPSEIFLIAHTKEQCNFSGCPWHSGTKK